VRKALDLLTKFVGSGHLDIRKILRIWRDESRYVIPLHEFLRALIYGDSVYYDPASSPVPNVFDIPSVGGREHFTILVCSITWSETRSTAQSNSASSCSPERTSSIKASALLRTKSISRYLAQSILASSSRRLGQPATGRRPPSDCASPRWARTSSIDLNACSLLRRCRCRHADPG